MKKTYIALLLSLFAMSTYGGTEIENNTTTIDRTNTNSSNGSYELVKTNSDGSFEMVLPSSRSSSEMLSPPHSPECTSPNHVEFNISNSQKTESNTSNSPVISPIASPIHLPVNITTNNGAIIRTNGVYIEETEEEPLASTRNRPRVHRTIGIVNPNNHLPNAPVNDQRYISFNELLHNSNLTDEEKFILRTNPDEIEHFEAISNERRSTASSNNSLQFPLDEQLTSRNNLPAVIPRTWRDENDFTPRRQLLPPPAPDQQPRLRTGSNGAPTISPINSRRNSNVSNTDEQLNNPYVSPQELREIVNSLQEANPTINFDINEINRHLNNSSPITINAPQFIPERDNSEFFENYNRGLEQSLRNDSFTSNSSIALPTEQPIIINTSPIVITTEVLNNNNNTNLNTDKIIVTNHTIHEAETLYIAPVISDPIVIAPAPVFINTNAITTTIQSDLTAPRITIQPSVIEGEELLIEPEVIPNTPQIRDDTLVLPPQTNIIVQQPQVAVQNPIIPEVIVQEQVLPTITGTDDNFYRTKQHFPELISELFSTSMFDLDGYYTLGIFSNYRYKNFKANTYGSSISVGEKHDKYAYSVGVGLIRSDLKYYELKKTVNTSLISVRLQYFIDETNSLNVVPSFAFSKFGKRYINNYNIKTYLESKLALIPFKLDMILGADSQFCKYNKGNNNTDAMTKLRLSKVYAKGNLKFTPSFTIGLYAPKNIIYLNQRLKFDINDSFGAIDLELFSKKKNYHFVVSGKISIFF